MSLRGKLETFADTAKKWAGVAWRRGGRVAWVVAATSIVMFLPLVMEIEREGSVIETDKLRIKDFRAQGYTDNQISQMGLSASVEPAVGLAAPFRSFRGGRRLRLEAGRAAGRCTTTSEAAARRRRFGQGPECSRLPRRLPCRALEHSKAGHRQPAEVPRGGRGRALARTPCGRRQ